ncbi:prevent-host-death protein [Chondrocystis sp. NIES-4102]|nr:prevent-host-death protein [Chondrocystis sp. NIES-4102]
MKIVNFIEVNNKLETILDSAIEDSEYTVIIREDADPAVVMSLNYFNSLLPPRSSA